jgi:hypothetical protein
MAKSGDINVNQQGCTNEEYAEKEKLEKKKKKDLTPEERARLEELKQKKTQRAEAISILRGISIRMPLLIYGAELKDEEEELTIDNFTNLVDDVSCEEFMPKGVTKDDFENFKKYYEADVFREAGKRIRSMARAADKFTIEERIERLAGIFNTFRNPDKETVLTPWRVVNMHMSDCLGGWCFYDEEFKQMLDVPRYVDRGEVTANVFRPESHVLEINSKSGLYPLYCAYNIYRTRVEAAKEKYGEVSHAFAMNLWDATIEENILVVCKTPMARSITHRTLAGFRSTRVNAQYYKDLIKNISEKPTAVVNTFRDGKHFWKINNNENMKIDAVVGNPPYQVNVGEKKDNYGMLIFNKFVEIGIHMNPNYVSMIFPSRWFTGGRGLDDFRNAMLHDDRIRVITDFVDSTDLFPTTDISGGINYILWDKYYHGLCDFTGIHKGKVTRMLRHLNQFGTFVRRNDALSIIEKIIAFGGRCMSETVSGQTPFGFITTFKGKYSPFDKSLSLYGSNGSITYVAREEVEKHQEWIDKYKVIFTKAAPGGGGSDKNGMYLLLSSLQILQPQEVCTQTFLVGNTFDRKEEAINCMNYLKCKFVRFLILQSMTSQDLSPERFRFVPVQDFSHPWTDAELYKKYNLTDEEIQFVESMIKPME